MDCVSETAPAFQGDWQSFCSHKAYGLVSWWLEKFWDL